MRQLIWIIAAMGLCWAPHGVAAPSPSGPEVFAQLATLQGIWHGKTSGGHEYTVSYRFTGGDSVLVETWALGSGRESMTLYALDNGRLLATHYCVQGNQPRLQFRGQDERGRQLFSFLDGANIHVPGKSHQYAFWMKVNIDGSFDRAETYVANDASSADAIEEGETIRFSRMATTAK